MEKLQAALINQLSTEQHNAEFSGAEGIQRQRRELQRLVMVRKTFRRETMTLPDFYLVWRENSNSGTPTYKHTSYSSAKAECERLTRLHGGKFHILAHVATAEKIDVVFKEIELEQIPF